MGNGGWIGRIAAVGLSAGAPLMATVASAQFRLDYAPSSIRAANANSVTPIKPNLGRINPLSPLGGPQGTPGTIAPSKPATPVQAYAGLPSPVPLAIAAPADPSVDDPSKPRQPLKPKSLSKGVAPRL